MRILIINISPRVKGTSNSAAEYIIKKLSSKDAQIIHLYRNLDKIQELLENIRLADTIVMVGACYVNSYPAETFALLEHMSKTDGILHEQSLYGFIQGGMPYVHTHVSGLNILENFAQTNKICWKGGFVMGGGATLDGQPLEHVIGAKK